MSEDKIFGDSCGVGDVIETTLSDGKVIQMVLKTPESAAMANELILTGRWKKSQKDTPDVH